jgi:aconitate hydratase
VSADTGERAKPLYDWRAQSTYIRRPPYWEGAPAGERTLTGMRPLVVLGDNITTDHLSPSKRNSRRLRRRRISDEDGPAGRGLQLVRDATGRSPDRPARHMIAGADYGQGSSRDWAAKGVRLAGAEAVVAEGFGRIHRTNLVGMGVLPLEFKPGVNRTTLAIDGTETFDGTGERRPRADLTLVIHRKNGERVEAPVTCRLDTAEEM